MKSNHPPNTLPNPPLGERPRERCLETGAACLSLRECLAVILGTSPVHGGALGLATRILHLAGAGLSGIDQERAFFNLIESCVGTDLQPVVGLGPAGQAKILAVFELAKRYTLHRYSYFKVKDSSFSQSRLSVRALEKVPLSFRVEPKEWLGFVPVYRTGALGGLCIVERGARTHVQVDPVELFARILALRPFGFFLFHNHPSGNPDPSSEDLDLTDKVGNITQELGVHLLGHWVVTPQTEFFLSPRIKT